MLFISGTPSQRVNELKTPYGKSENKVVKDALSLLNLKNSFELQIGKKYVSFMFRLCLNNCVSKFNLNFQFHFINNVLKKINAISNLKFEFF